MKDSLPALPTDNTQAFSIPFYSEGEFSMHELIEHVLRHYNQPAIVTLSSFSITEEAVRSIINLRDDNLILEISCLFDTSVKHHKLRLLFFGLNVVDHVYLTENHSKIVLFQFVDKLITVIGSANLNKNHKIEAGLVMNNPDVFNFFYNKLSKSIRTAQKVMINDFE